MFEEHPELLLANKKFLTKIYLESAQPVKMKDLPPSVNQIERVNSFQDLVSTPFAGEKNAIFWNRKLVGDFQEIINKVELHENIATLDPEELLGLRLTEQGQLAREILLSDLKALQELGASPILNLIKYYDRDDSFPSLPTDVYSFHVDKSPVPTSTYLCTYLGESSDILPNSQAIQKMLIPEIRQELKELYDGPESGFETFLSENFFDLHYVPQPKASIRSLGIGHLWKLAVDHPKSNVLPCIHRAPVEKKGQTRLLLIC